MERLEQLENRVKELEALLAAARADVDSGWLPSCHPSVARDGGIVVAETSTTRSPTCGACFPTTSSVFP